MANAEPVSLWQDVQWQQWVTRGAVVSAYVRALQMQWPVSGTKSSILVNMLWGCILLRYVVELINI